jgi:hypothetical protein
MNTSTGRLCVCFLRLNGRFPGLAELNIKSTVRHLSFWWHLSNGSSHLVWSKHHCDHRPCRSFAMLGAKAVRIPRRRIAASASQTRCQNTVRTTRLDPGNHRSPQRCGSFVPRGLHAWPPTCQAENQGDYTWNMTLRTSSWLTVAMLISFRPWKSNRCTARSYCPAPQCHPAAGSDPYGLCLKPKIQRQDSLDLSHFQTWKNLHGKMKTQKWVATLGATDVQHKSDTPLSVR